MQHINIADIRLTGALDADVTADGIVPRRLPSWTRHQISDPTLPVLVTMPAGVRLEFTTTSDHVELDVLVTRVTPMGRPPQPAAFDLVSDGLLVNTQATDVGTLILYDPLTAEVEFELGESTVIRFDGLEAGGGTYEIWLPHDSAVELRGLRVADGATFEQRPRSRRRWVHYGSSISHCMEALTPTGTWPSIVARHADLDLNNLAFAGQCMLDQMVARTIRDLPADLISVKAGINIVNGDTMRERTFTMAVHGFLDTVRDGHPSTPLALVTPIICPVAEDHPGPTIAAANGEFRVPERSAELSVGALTLRHIRQLLAHIVEARRAEGDHNLHLVDGLTLFGPDDAVDLPDGLHPSPEGYHRMGDRFHDLMFRSGGVFAHEPAA
ncbi:MAG TPA: SGNH/GDSL hydrolase family protein [Ilumatobacter sp.]|nr:SGNH/GDSL hydrolase family protein [Ilumatobacter sp.]